MSKLPKLQSLGLGVSVLAVAAFIGGPALAQISDEIIVTARKKEETLLDAPIAISVFGAVELEQAGFVDIIDISKAAPGVFIEDFNQTGGRVNTTPRFRGVFLSTGNRLQQTATVFLDGVYMSGGIQTIGVNELERVEIIKGPQSALFGRNTFAGAINYITKDPSDEFRADIDVTAATLGDYSVAVGVEGPITDSLSYRIGGSYQDKQGHYTNFAAGDANGTRLGDENQWTINGSLLFEPTDDVRLKLRGSYRKLDDGAPAINHSYGVNFHNFGGFLMDGGLAVQGDSVVPAPNDGSSLADGTRGESVYSGTITRPDLTTIGLNSGFDTITAFRNAVTGDARYSASNSINSFKYNPNSVDEFGLKLDSFRLSADGEFDLSENVTLNILGGYNEEQYGLFTDFDYTRDVSFTAFQTQEIKDYTLEARLSGNLLDDKLFWKVGGSLTDIQIEANNGTVNFFAFPIVFGDIFRNDRVVTGAQTLGVFGSVDYQLTDTVSVTLEGRYQEDEIQENGVNAGLPTAISPATITNFLPRGTLRYQPSDATTLYLTYSEGNLPGGFNPQIGGLDASEVAELQGQAPGASVTFDEESLVNHEFGWKQQYAGGRGAFNLAAFYMKRTDEIFRSIELISDPGSAAGVQTVAFNSNGASTDIFGFEFDTFLEASDNLDLRASFAYVDAKIKSFPAGAGTGDFGDIYGPGANVEGQVAPRFPPITASMGATWEQPFEAVSNFDTWFLRGDIYYTGNYWESNSNTAELDVAVDGNFRTGIRGDAMTLEIFVKNAFNETTPTGAFNFADLSIANRTQPGGFFDFGREGVQLALRDRRQFGVRASYTF